MALAVAAEPAGKRKITYRRPWLYPAQQAAMFDGRDKNGQPARLSLVEATTKAGKTVSGMAWILEQMMIKCPPNGNCWWVAPVYGQAQIAFNRTLLALPRWIYTSTESPPKIRLITGQTLWFKSGEKPNNLYGEDVYAAVIDEASRLREEAWHAVRSTLTATRGPIRMIGNVHGRQNWFYRMCRRAESGLAGYSYAKLTAYDAVKGGVLHKDEIEEARRDLPEQVFKQLYLAIPTDDDTNPFGLTHIEKCITAALSDEKTVACGVDLAKSTDWSVTIGLDATATMTGFDRWQSDWEATGKRVMANVGHAPTLVDSTGVGDPIVERLSKARSTVRGYLFSQSSKQHLMELLAVGIQHHELGILDGLVRKELEQFEYRHTRSGTTYSAPDGVHDDCVMSLALAYKQFCMVRPMLNAAHPLSHTRVSPWFGGEE